MTHADEQAPNWLQSDDGHGGSVTVQGEFAEWLVEVDSAAAGAGLLTLRWSSGSQVIHLIEITSKAIGYPTDDSQGVVQLRNKQSDGLVDRLVSGVDAVKLCRDAPDSVEFFRIDYKEPAIAALWMPISDELQSSGYDKIECSLLFPPGCLGIAHEVILATAPEAVHALIPAFIGQLSTCEEDAQYLADIAPTQPASVALSGEWYAR